MQLLRSVANHLARKRAAPPITAEVCLDVVCAYRAHAGAISPEHGYAPMLDI